MAEVNITQAGPKDKEKWDAYVESHPDVSPYHLFAWKDTVEQAYGHKGYYLIAEKNNSVCGILPAIHMKLPFLLNQLVSLPYCDIGDILANNDETKKELLISINSLADHLKCKSVEIRGQQPEFDIAGLKQSTDINANKVRMLFDLPETADALWGSFRSKLRSQIRKAEKNGLVFSWGEEKALDAFYKVFSQNMRDLGSPVHAQGLLKAVLQNYGDRAKIGLVYMQNKVVGVGLILSAANKISIPWASTLREFNRLGPNMILYWNFLKYSVDHGFKQFDFGRSTPGEGTYKFKQQWGAAPKPLYWYNSLQSNNGNQASGSKKMAIVTGLWQKLPVSAANFIGPNIRKYISL